MIDTPRHLQGSVVDFSQLRRASEAHQAAPASAGGAASTKSASGAGFTGDQADHLTGFDPSVPLTVPSLVFEATVQNLPELLKLSDLVPILVDVFTSRAAASTTLSERLVAEVQKRNGTLLLIRLDGDANPQLLRAFQVEHLPSVTALLKGQSIPLFAGEQSVEAISTVVDRMLAVAKDNGIVGTVVLDTEAAAAVEVEPELPPKHQAAFDLIDQGDYEGAIKQYQSILAETPADQLAISGLAQVQLLKRVDGVDFAEIASKDVASSADALLKADVLAVHGNFDAAFTVILDWFQTTEKAQQEALREHLLDLFKVAPQDDPAVAKARIRLANLLF